MIHVIPINDLKSHKEETTCDCQPEVKTDGEMLVIHNSFDGRELTELGLQLGAKLNVKSREGRDLIEGDVIETIQGSKFLCVTFHGIKPLLIGEDSIKYDCDNYMTPNIFHIGNIVENIDLRKKFIKIINPHHA